MRNRYFVSGKIAVIELPKFKTNYTFYTIVDKEDLERIQNEVFSISVLCDPYTNYAICNLKNGSSTGLHRLILKTPKQLVVDHIYHNGLDNRKRFLRNCTRTDNRHNRREIPARNPCYGLDRWNDIIKEEFYESTFR